MADRRAFLQGMVGALPAAILPTLATSPASGKASRRIATMEEHAAVEFEPLKYGEDFDILSEEEWSEAYQLYIVASNVASRLLAQTKPELVERSRHLMEEEDLKTLKALRSMLEDAEGFLKAATEPLSAAATRLLCCCCAVECEGGARV